MPKWKVFPQLTMYKISNDLLDHFDYPDYKFITYGTINNWLCYLLKQIDPF